MIFFFKGNNTVFGLETHTELNEGDIEKLCWLFGEACLCDMSDLSQSYIGPRREMITPWSTNAVEITQNMGISGVIRIEEFFTAGDNPAFDPMLQALYTNLDQNIYHIEHQSEPVMLIDDIAAYNSREGLALNDDEIEYLNDVSKKLGRKLTDSEVFGFSQVNSEHCRHKIFNGTFVIDGVSKPTSLFDLIRKTSASHPGRIVSAYKDNVAFVKGPKALQFAPLTQESADFFHLKEIETVISLKAETHNFPTTVEPFNGAATGSGGEIRDRMAGGTGSIPIAGTAVYMTSYPRLEAGKVREENIAPRPWLYQNPKEILIKASNGASDFGNKFGQPLICGSLLTFEHIEKDEITAYDKVIMLAGGIGFANAEHSQKKKPQKGDKIIVMGGDNYRIGMGGGAVSSVATGEFKNSIELNAIQRSNPEMQKRVFNAIRAMAESDNNPVVSIHDHGAGGHLNSLSELVEESGGSIEIEKLPLGDPTLSLKEIIGNESQERMGLIMKDEDTELLKKISERERAPVYIVGQAGDDLHFSFKAKEGLNPIDMELKYLFGKAPKTIMRDENITKEYANPQYDESKLNIYLEELLQLESVACKDWLTNKVDRSVTGRIAMQQCTGSLQLPLNNLGIVSIDYSGEKGIATSLGHAPVTALIDPEKGSILSIARSLTNIIWAPLQDGIRGISLSANWMWPCKKKGEDARLYKAVEAASEFAIALGINIPTGKDSLSMTQKYPSGQEVKAPGTVIITAVAEVSDIKKAISPAIKPKPGTAVIYIDFSLYSRSISGSAFAQTLGALGNTPPTIADAASFAKTFDAVQQIVEQGKILAGHDISGGGLITSLLEMCFTDNTTGMKLDFSEFDAEDIITLLFSENPGIIIQTEDLGYVEEHLRKSGVAFAAIGSVVNSESIEVVHRGSTHIFDIPSLRDLWFKTSYLLDRRQCGPELALMRYSNYKKQLLEFSFSSAFSGKLEQYQTSHRRTKASGIKAAIIREKGVNGDREMAYSMFLAGFDVKDVHMTDLISGRENLEDVNFIVFVGGFSNSDVLGSAKGWAGAFLYNPPAREALEKFYARPDTLSLGICNGCQLMVELGLITPQHEVKPQMLHNDSKKFESGFISVDIVDNNSVMLASLADSRLGIWVAHGEGKFDLPYDETAYNIPLVYTYNEYPGNPNGSEFNAAAICSDDGRHLAMMPHLERAVMPWQWAYYPVSRQDDQVSPWLEAFVNAKKWVENKVKST